jgi:spore coat protein U-like protein
VKRALVLAAVLAALCGVREATAQLGLTCSVSPASMNFGTYVGALSTPGATPITVKCTVLLAYNVGLNAGTGSGATTTTRKMTGPGSATLSYQMFQNSALTTNWGNTTGTDTESGTGTGSSQTLEIYPEAAAGQYVVPGTYTDTITISATNVLGTGTATMSVTAVVQATCLASASALNFGTYSGLLINMSSAITVTCTNTTTFNIGLNAGTATSATVTTRKMTSPASATLNYTLFRDSGRTQNWGNTVGTDTLASTGTGSPIMYGVYGQIPAGQYVAPQTYNDTIIATITY